MQDPSDNLSPLARRILKHDAAAAYEKLVPGYGDGNAAILIELGSAEPEALCSAFPTDKDFARAMLSGLWLWHDFLDESHNISQALHNPTGSFWHAIMHRREGDFSNAKYWYAKVGNHPVLPAISAQAGAIVNSLPADKTALRLSTSPWNGAALVDLVEQVHKQPAHPLFRTAIALQQLEWRVLFEYCARMAQA